LTDVKESEEENTRERGMRGSESGPKYAGTSKTRFRWRRPTS